MILILRGHVRNSFQTNELYLFVQMLTHIYTNVSIYIQTMNITQNNLSWRSNIPIISTEITTNVIYSYFKDLSKYICSIHIYSDQDIQLIGSTTHVFINKPISVASSRILTGWKNMWWGIHTIIQHIICSNKHSDTEFVINTRFDLFTQEKYNYCNLYTIFYLLEQHEFSDTYHIKQNTFLTNKLCTGIDNFYIGNIQTMYKLSFMFHTQLEYIITKYNHFNHQEFYVYYINCEI